MTRRLAAARWRTLLPLALLVLGSALRCFRLGDQNLWWDEGLAIWAVRKTLTEATLWTASDVHPPLFFWTLWQWVRLVGEQPFAARYITVLWSLLLAALAFALGRRLAGQRGGLLALTLVVLSRFMVWWSTELRMYMLAALAVCAAVYATIAWLDAQERRPDDGAAAAGTGRGLRALAGYVLAATAALYSVYLTAVALAVCNAVVLLFLLRAARHAPLRTVWRRAALWLAAQVAVVLLYVPWLMTALPRMQSWRVAGEPASMGFVLQLWATLLATGVSVALDAVRGVVGLWWLAAIVGPGVFVAWRMIGQRMNPPPGGLRPGVRLRGRGGVGAMGLLGGLLVVAPGAVWAATQPRSIFYSPQVEARYFVAFAAPVYVLAGWLLAWVVGVRRWLGAGLAAVAVGVMLWVLPPHHAERRLRDDFASMSLAIWSQAEPGDVVLLVSGNRYPLFLYDYEMPPVDEVSPYTWQAPDAGPFERPPVLPWPDKGTAPVTAKADWQARLAEVAAEHPRVWLVEADADLQDPERVVKGWLDEHRSLVLSETYGANALHLYNRETLPPRVMQLDSRWPGLRQVELPASAVGDLHPVLGLPARTVMGDDPLTVTVFRRLNAVQARHGVTLGDSTGVDPAYWAAEIERPPWLRSVRQAVQLAGTRGLPAGRFPLRLDGSPVAEVIVAGAPELAAPQVPQAAEVGPFELLSAAWSPAALRPGDTLAVDSRWQLPPGGANTDLVLFAHLVGPTDNPATGTPVWAGQDGPPSSGPWRRPVAAAGDPGIFDRRLLVLPPDAPPGSYTLEMGLYDPNTGERAAVSGPTADAANRRVILGTLEVKP